MPRCFLAHPEHTNGKPCAIKCREPKFPGDEFWYDDTYGPRTMYMTTSEEQFHIVTISSVGDIHLCWVAEHRRFMVLNMPKLLKGIERSIK